MTPVQYHLMIPPETKGQFAGGKVDPVEAGKKGGQVGGTASGGDSASAQQGSDYKPTEHDGLRKGEFLSPLVSVRSALTSFQTASLMAESRAIRLQQGQDGSP